MLFNSGKNLDRNSGRTIMSSINGAVRLPLICFRKRLKLSCLIFQYFCVSAADFDILNLTPNSLGSFGKLSFGNSASITNFGKPNRSNRIKSGKKLQANLIACQTLLPFKKLGKNLMARRKVLSS